MGGVYGSFSYSKRAYDDFFQKNQSTLFQNQFEAKVSYSKVICSQFNKTQICILYHFFGY